MQYLFGSEIHQFCFTFRDYVRAKYQVELELREVERNGLPLLGVFIAEDCPDLEKILQEQKAFLSDPFNEYYQQASWQTGEVNNTSPVSLNAYLPNLHIRPLLLQDKFTLFITALCVIIYVLQCLGWEEEIFSFAHYPSEQAQTGQLWRYLSHSWVHLSPWHILFNLTWWWLFAGAIERAFGSLALIGLYVCSAVLTGVAQNWVSGPAFFGLSGVVYTVLGFVFVADKFGRSSFNLPQGFFTMLIVGILLGFISPIIGVEMGNTAHITGLLCGLLLGFLPKIRQ